MANVVRFTLSTARTLYISGVGPFIDGVLDVDANDLALLTKTRYLVQPYRAVEIGTVDASTPKPSLPAVPGPPSPDPYPQYLTLTEAVSSSEVRAALVDAVEDAMTVHPTGAWDFAQAPTVAGVAIGTGGGSGSDPTKVDTSAVGAVNGVASLGSDGKLPAAQLPDLAITQFLGTTTSDTQMVALPGQRGDWTIRSDTGTVFILTADTPASLGAWIQLSYPAAPVTSVAGKTGVVTLAKGDVGLGNVDNTADASKPVSAAQQTALDAKAPLTGVEGIKVHDGTTGGGTRPTGYARVRWVGGTVRPTNMVAGDIWEHDA